MSQVSGQVRSNRIRSGQVWSGKVRFETLRTWLVFLGEQDGLMGAIWSALTHQGLGVTQIGHVKIFTFNVNSNHGGTGLDV